MRGLFIMLAGFAALVSGHAVRRENLNPKSIKNTTLPATSTLFKDGIVVTHERDPNPSAKHCIDSNGPAIGGPRICTCYASPKAISYDRAILRKAIDRFCKGIPKYTFGGPSNWWWSIWLPYRPDAKQNEYVVLVRLSYTGEFDTCGELHLDYETCFSAFHVPFDSCDIFAENGKYGGRAYDPCFEYTVDPNPGINNPDLAIPPMV
ncbi:hypothetical protein KC331_g3530 [Hortaea werneckii]|nr:hypothetical protein KC331_g3530 [Hortaea werneckii]KAI7711159.1 hypothetical protein KC353_g9184 [Hortaea werneckii]